jgi:alkanesulfonate monooxygenase SsuD/methylene tetrahydromethanopterin reductase-like flavin-dependent oxidoreductase (luciferase family)
LLTEDTGVPFDELQAEQIALYRAAWEQAGWEREPRISVSRSVLPIVTDIDRMYFGDRSGRDGADQVGYLDGTLARFGKSYIGEPDVIADELSRDAAVRAADTLLLTVPNQLGVEYNTRLLETVARQIAPAIGWQPATDPAPANGRGPGEDAGIPASADQQARIASGPGRRAS